MAHKVIFSLPKRELGREDIEFVVEQDGKRFGTLLVSKGAIEWRPTNKVYRRKLSWSKFDQLIDDELQPMWIAVLLWRDVQIRLTVIRPTLSVMAFEAPGALGCEQAANVIRRFDASASWGYAEAEGRAVAIQRLVGYDSQK